MSNDERGVGVVATVRDEVKGVGVVAKGVWKACNEDKGRRVVVVAKDEDKSGDDERE